MATPTQIVTLNTQKYLGGHYDVVMAVRVEWGAGAAEASRKQGYVLFAHLWTPFVVPVLTLIRGRTAKRRMHADPNAGVGILALTADEQRILLSAMPMRMKTPTGIVEKLPPGTALLPNIELMETDTVPALTVDRYELVVDRIDFKALVTAVKAGEVSAPKLEAVLDRLEAVGWKRYG